MRRTGGRKDRGNLLALRTDGNAPLNKKKIIKKKKKKNKKEPSTKSKVFDYKFQQRNTAV
jgi:hypothetical protein